MTEPDTVIIFKATKTAPEFWPSNWKPPPRALVFVGYALLFGLLAAVFIFLTLLWLISGLVALTLPFDPEVDLGNRLGGALLLGGIFLLGCFVLLPTLRDICFLRDERFVIDPAAVEVRWEKDYSRGRPSRIALSFDAISGVSERALDGADTGDFHGVGLDVPTAKGRRKWRMVAVLDLPQDARETAERLRAALLVSGWIPPGTCHVAKTTDLTITISS